MNITKQARKVERAIAKSDIVWCEATAKLGRYTIQCCTNNHPGYKHYNPRVLKTCGGTMHNISGWSGYTHDKLEKGDL